MAYIHTKHNFNANFAHFLRMRRRMRKKCAKKVFLLFFYLRNFNACVNAYVEFAQILFLRNCAKCANIRADLQLCALKNHFFAPCIRALRRLGMHQLPLATGSPPHSPLNSILFLFRRLSFIVQQARPPTPPFSISRRRKEEKNLITRPLHF